MLNEGHHLVHVNNIIFPFNMLRFVYRLFRLPALPAVHCVCACKYIIYRYYNHIHVILLYLNVELMIMHICRLMRRRIKVADPRIYLVSAAYIRIREEVVDDNNIIMRTRRFACLEETQGDGFAWLVVANRTLPYRSSSTIAICATRLPSARRLA